ncbi:MAG: hypothetical protein AB8B99_21185, partial [Phormidesmis sp.]
KTLDEEIAKLEKALKQQAKEDPNESTYRSVPGVGPLSARILSNELGEETYTINYQASPKPAA